MKSSMSFAHLTRRSETLYERLANLAESRVERPQDAAPVLPGAASPSQKLLNGWCKAYARGRFDALERRLTWDGLDTELAAMAFRRADALPPVEPAKWTQTLEAVAEAGKKLAIDIAAGRELPEPWQALAEEIPFLELFLPWTMVASEGLWNDDDRTTWTAAAQQQLELHLLREIAAFGEIAAYELFSTSRTVASSKSSSASSSGDDAGDMPKRAEGEIPQRVERSLYRGFVLTALADLPTAFFQHYPALGRRSAETARQWRHGVRELSRRLRLDAKALAENFTGEPRGGRASTSGPEPIGLVSSIEASLSDRHGDGRHVHLVTFESGLRLIYKPRDTDLEKAVERWFHWCAHEGFEWTPRAPRILARDGYGWVEFIERAASSTELEAQDFFKRAGALTAFCYALRAQDLHAENLIATHDGPVVIDSEMFLQPIRAQISTHAGGLAESGGGSCLESGLLVEPGRGADGESRDWGGLRPVLLRRGAVNAGRAWNQINSDHMTVSAGEIDGQLGDNVLTDGHQAYAPENFRSELLEGFEKAYRFLLDKRPELLSAEGPLRFFAGTRARILLRPSQEYGRVLGLMTVPRNQRSGLTASLLCEALISVFADADEPPLLWPLVSDERDALLIGDIPRFVADAETGTVTSPAGTPLTGYFQLSGLAAVRRRLEAFGERDLAAQRELLQLALKPPRTLACLDSDDSAPVDSELPAEEFRDLCLRVATDLGDEMLESTPLFPPSEEPRGLARGPLGVALFFTALSRALGADGDGARFKAAAVKLVTAKPAVKVRSLGGFSGLGSEIYAISHLARLLDAPELLKAAAEGLESVDPTSFDSQRSFDLEGGAAGCALGLLALYQTSDQEAALELAVAFGDSLIDSQRQLSSSGAAWPDTNGWALAGFAHGAAGIARALAALGQATSAPRFHVSAAAALGYERSLFDAERGNWPILAPLPGRSKPHRGWAVGWCHGAPGIALSRLFLPPSFADEAWKRELEAALRTTASAPMSDLDHLCCGAMGRASVLLSASRRLASTPLAKEAHRLTAAVLERARADRRFRLSTERLATRKLQPGLLKGLAGVGYQLVRQSRAHKDLPDLLALELPAELDAALAAVETPQEP